MKYSFSLSPVLPDHSALWTSNTFLSATTHLDFRMWVKLRKTYPQTNKSASPVICLFQSIVSPVHIQLSKLYPQVNIMVLIILNFRWVIAALPGTGLNAYTISMLSFYSQDNDSRDVGNKRGKSYYWPNLPPSGNFQVTLYGGVNRMERTRLLELRWSWKYRKAQTASVCRREYLTKLCS